MKHPLKGWRKILFTTLGGLVCTLYPPAAPYVLPLVKTYVLAQGSVDAFELVGAALKAYQDRKAAP